MRVAGARHPQPRGAGPSFCRVVNVRRDDDCDGAGLARYPLRTMVDVALSRCDEMWAAAGHPHYVFPTTYDELLRITGGDAAEVGE